MYPPDGGAPIAIGGGLSGHDLHDGAGNSFLMQLRISTAQLAFAQHEAVRGLAGSYATKYCVSMGLWLGLLHH
jgi:hypothetical protein